MEKKKVRDRTGLKQIAFDVPEEWHAHVKQRASELNLTLKDWILQACEAKLAKERELGWE